MVITDCTITECWDELLKASHYSKKTLEVIEFNKNNIYKKRGIGTSPVKFGVGYDNNSENQGGILLYCYPLFMHHVIACVNLMYSRNRFILTISLQQKMVRRNR